MVALCSAGQTGSNGLQGRSLTDGTLGESYVCLWAHPRSHLRRRCCHVPRSWHCAASAASGYRFDRDPRRSVLLARRRRRRSFDRAAVPPARCGPRRAPFARLALSSDADGGKAAENAAASDAGWHGVSCDALGDYALGTARGLPAPRRAACRPKPPPAPAVSPSLRSKTPVIRALHVPPRLRVRHALVEEPAALRVGHAAERGASSGASPCRHLGLRRRSTAPSRERLGIGERASVRSARSAV